MPRTKYLFLGILFIDFYSSYSLIVVVSSDPVPQTVADL
jgi:hypothetical protein